MKNIIPITIAVVLFSSALIAALPLITFDRNLDCHACGQHKAPPSTDVNMAVSVSSDGSLENETLIDYFPIEWTMIEDYGGTVEDHNSTYKKISWSITENVTSVERSYIIQSPSLTTPPTKYYFFTSVGNETSEPWMVIVSDVEPPEPSWDTGDYNYTIWTDDTSLTWNAGTKICEANLTDDNSQTVSCINGGILPNASYRVQAVLKNKIGSLSNLNIQGDKYVWNMNVNGSNFWAGSDVILGSCAFEDFDSDDGDTNCSISFDKYCSKSCLNSRGDVRIENNGSGNVVIAKNGGVEGFMYNISVSNDIVLSNASYMFFEYGTPQVDEDSSKIAILIDYANESEGDIAIEEGINNSLPDNPIETDQQVYLFDGATHSLGSFDKTTTQDNQTWVFNYVTSGESFTNIGSLFDVLNVWENETLTYGEIVGQVQNFIA